MSVISPHSEVLHLFVAPFALRTPRADVLPPAPAASGPESPGPDEAADTSRSTS